MSSNFDKLGLPDPFEPVADVDLDDLRRRTGRRPVKGPEFEPGTGHRPGDGRIDLFDPTDPRGSYGGNEPTL